MAGRRSPAGMRRQSLGGLSRADGKRWAFASKEDRMIYSKKESPQGIPQVQYEGNGNSFFGTNPA